MGETASHGRLINPCFFHLQKLELELKCPACLNLLQRPVLLPCDHIFCSSCVTASPGCGLACPMCKFSFLAQDLRTASHMETIINVYKSMNAAFSRNLCLPRLQVDLSGPNLSAVKHQDLCNTGVVGKSQDNDANNIRQQEITKSRMEAFAEQRGSPCSPPLSSGLKYSDDDSNDRGSVLVVGETNQTTFQVEENHGRDLKRQKLNTDSHNDLTKGDMDDKLNDVDCQYGNKNTSFCTQTGHSGAKNFAPSSMANEGTSDLDLACEFCHSSKESKASGPMGHYADGQPVDGEAARRPNVLHVHQKCIEWAPQVFFVGDTAKNLEAEVSRASKIKCGHCGEKGAALGCFVKSCHKSFHVPCAVEIKGCRWDCDNFLMLCPAHTSRKLPSDRFNTGKNDKNLSPSSSKLFKSSANRSSGKQHAHELWSAPLETTKGWVLCGSALSVAEKDMMAKFARLTGAVVTKDWRPDVTHVIASTDQYGACSRTLKFLMAILSGKWVLKIDWVKACLEAKRPVYENSYEISHDVHGCFDGPRNGRIRLMEQAPKLFSGVSFCFSGDFVPTYRGYLEDLISAAGGDVLQENTVGRPSTTRLVVYNVELPPGGDGKGAMDSRLYEANAVAARIGAQVVGHTWVLDSIAGSKKLPVFS